MQTRQATYADPWPDFAIEELRWDYGVTKDGDVADSILAEIKYRGESLDGPARRKDGAFVKGRPLQGELVAGVLVKAEACPHCGQRMPI
jgi:hypothetical protein